MNAIENTTVCAARGTRKERVGSVVGCKADKTISVVFERRLRHPLYGKFMKLHKKFAVHDENNDAKVGDIVKIMETRPLSKTKRWRLVEILKSDKS